ncbi:hypothetical protein LshimejAT787_2600410 [Lyophyllum shimeji]|uniref:DUF8191 domain-containing protein n=1 Tax=Lyophyllum shimeji TaxID=47721 RepID=A0A9P3Q247_LYOSH|nr:hypothetical protein LshimejAT787_2600410 [Lyophyllum shimeji]
MPEDIQALNARVARRDQTIASLKKRIAVLECEASRKSAASVEVDDESDEEEGLPEPLYDKADDTYRCTECGWEVVEGFCEACRKEFNWSEDNEESSLPADSLYNEASNDTDRDQVPRGTTPLRDVGPFRPLPGYSLEDYEALLQRGATRLMIETFNLEYSHENGIFAWADSTLYSEFAGPKMQRGDFWKIQLGRRFDLDEDDLDGSLFVEGILEEAILFPEIGQAGKWETVEERPGIWVTRMVNSRDCQDGDMDEDEGEDEEDDVEEEDDEEDEDEDAEDLQQVYDRRLEIPFVDDGPVLTCPGYDTTDDVDSDNEMTVEGENSMEHDDDVDMEDTGAEIQASVADGVWHYNPRSPTPEDFVPTACVSGDAGVPQSASQLGAAGQAVKQEIATEEGDETTTLESDSDSADSDFDSDEELSGDEDLEQHAALLMRYKTF